VVVSHNLITEKIQKYSAFLPFIGGYFILYGIVDLLTFYREFNINIMSYVGFSEIITYFIRDIYLVFLHVAVMIVSAIFLSRARKRQSADLEQPISKKRKWIVALVICAIAIQMGIMISNGDWLNTVRIGIPLALTIVISYFIKEIIVFISLYAALTLLFSAYMNALSTATNLKNGKVRNYIEFIVDDQLIASDSTHFVIGKTEQYIFYHDLQKKITTAFPMNQVERIILPEKAPG
jgi:hypothetical protein